MLSLFLLKTRTFFFVIIATTTWAIIQLYKQQITSLSLIKKKFLKRSILSFSVYWDLLTSMMAEEAGEGGGRAGFYRRGNEWFCSTLLQSDIIVKVEGIFFHLHKFPLISKCGKIARLLEDAHDSKDNMQYELVGCPGGPEGFCIAARFCYGAQVELTKNNALLVYCAAEYLEMTEEYDNDNLLNMVQSFIHKTILRSWEDCILTLQGCQKFIPKAENLPVVQKCLDALSVMACTDPSLFGWPMLLYGSLQSPGGSILWNGINTGARIRSKISNWWFEDVSCFNYPMFKKLMETMSKRGIRPENIAGALMYYARKYLPGLDRWQSGQGGKLRSIASLSMMPAAVDQKALVESIIELLPNKKGKSYCRFLLGLLRLSILLDIEQSHKETLERIIGMQLEYATLDGLLVPNFSGSDNLYDTDCIERIIRHFSSIQKLNIASFSPTSSDHAILPSSNHLNNVTKLINNYLAEVAPDVNLKAQKMWFLVEAFPESLRTSDDGVYRAVDIYLKEHPWLVDDEREKLCSVINWAKLSIDACTHATQNERLPLRRVFQVLFFEQMQLRSALSNYLHSFDNENYVTSTVNESTGEILQRDGFVSVIRERQHLRTDVEHLQSKVRDLELEFLSIKQKIGKFSQSSKVGCIHLPLIKDFSSDIIESAGSNPRRSTDKPHASHRSRHARRLS
ncbi:hypothetical protein IEQ34_007706 [Dendrobium chrysotoxum]|uniref:NPH3 domain-containing protein n=1 Tax=Dendrobium chrysotoxum TaxID=161865 RepID=A0AAV7GMU3_DENCH|nr:hypothetical protein IEQ34_007706 [Dendrobium chrysotoxum]